MGVGGEVREGGQPTTSAVRRAVGAGAAGGALGAPGAGAVRVWCRCRCRCRWVGAGADAYMHGYEHVLMFFIFAPLWHLSVCTLSK